MESIANMHPFVLVSAIVAITICVVTAILYGRRLTPAIRAALGKSPQRDMDRDILPVITQLTEGKTIRVLKLIADGSAEPIVFITTDCIIRVFNRAAEALTGYSEEEVVGVDVSVIMPRSDEGVLHRDHVNRYLDERRDHTVARLLGVQRGITLGRKNAGPIAATLSVTHIENGVSGFWATIQPAEMTVCASLREEVGGCLCVGENCPGQMLVF